MISHSYELVERKAPVGELQRIARQDALQTDHLRAPCHKHRHRHTRLCTRFALTWARRLPSFGGGGPNSAVDQHDSYPSCAGI